MEIQLKRVYDPPAPLDGARYLVDRIWPRGVSKEALALAGWLKEVAPSDRLRRWFGHDPERWEAFRQRYCSELEQNPHAVDVLRQAARHGPVTLLYAAADPVHNQAVVLREFLLHQPTAPSLPAAPVGPGALPVPGNRAKQAGREDRGRPGSSARRPPRKRRTS